MIFIAIFLYETRVKILLFLKFQDQDLHSFSIYEALIFR